MVNFGAGTSWIKLVDDINSTNKNEIFNTIDNCDLYITQKFPMPTNKNEVAPYNNKIEELLNDIKENVLKGNSKVITNETQFNNFKIKVNFWCENLFREVPDNGTIVIQNTLSKHEWEMVKLLNKTGINILVISDNIKELDTTDIENVDKIITGTSEHIEYIKETQIKPINNKVYKTIEEIEKALYETKEQLRLIVSGITNYRDTCNFYGKIYKETLNNIDYILANNGFSKPTYEQTSVIPRLKIDKHDYILTTILAFVKIKNTKLSNSIKESIQQEFNKAENKELKGEILYNKLVYTVCVINTLFSTKTPKYIVYYGKVSNNDKIVLGVLSRLEAISILVLCSDKTKVGSIGEMQLLELENSSELFDMPIVDTRDNASTLAAQAEHRANTSLFNGDTLGMYKPGQFRTCNTINFSTTYDEIKLWWNKEMYLRPNFKSHGDCATIPTIFKVIKGVNDKNYLEEIQQYACGKTILCLDASDIDALCSTNNRVHILRATDINGTKFEDQKPFYENNKLNKVRIKNDINYTYSFLDMNKQDLILDKIEDILNHKYIEKTVFNNNQVYIDTILNLLLNLDKKVLQYIQWFEFYTYNPNLVLMLNTEKALTKEQFILLLFLKLVGFDILIFVPTCYSSIERFVGPEFIYDTHKIGEANYNVIVNEMYVTPNIQINDKPKKQGFFSKLFS